MRDQEFKSWLEKRLWKGAPLKPHAIRNRLARVNRVERVLKAMGYPYNNIDQVLESVGVDEILTKLNADTGAREGWLKDLLPKAKDPGPHLRNMLAATRQYGRFANGEDAQSNNGDDDENLPEDENDDDDHHLVSQNPTNLILYGPPGTGKTYSTALEAVHLCDGEAPHDRKDLMRRYHALRREGRIDFVTFHQSFTYEDFVEGLRPETEPSDAGASVGFRLKPQQGVFRKIAALAEQASKAASTPHRVRRLDLSGRQFWKMGLGAIGTEDHVYEDAIEGGYIVLGWGGSVDWSDPVYDDIAAVRKKWAEVGSGDSRPSNVTQLWPFRSEMKKGDIVIVPYGNSAFRAIGEVTGDYTFVPTDNGSYNHRRSVNWLLVLDKELALDTIVDGAFTMRTLYRLEPRRVRMEAISSLIDGAPDASPGEPATSKPYVLVIDEINRANISKVFGELITLIEQNKRLGMSDEITVRLPYSGEEFGVPANLHIIGTMNTADRSIALLDTALRRRFTFREMMPKPELLADAARRTDVPLVDVLRTMNERIEYLFDREHQIGHAFFIDCNSRDDVDAVMRYRVIPLLQEYFFEDWSRLAQVLNEKKQAGDGAFLRCERVRVPPGADGEDRWRWSIREMFAENAYEHLLATAATE